MPIVTPLRRTAIIIRDMERSLQFYGQVLGLNVWRQGESGADNPALYMLLGAPPCKVRYVIMQSEDVEWGMVGLFELTDPAPADDTHPAIDRANRGEACLVFHTPDVRRIHRGALAMGITVLCPPTRLVLKEFGLESLEMTVRDPNGVLLNFIQNLRGGIGPENRFPGIAGQKKPRKPRAGASRSRVAVQRRTAASKTVMKAAPGPKAGKVRKPRSGGSPGRRSG
jgi:catechol 2,3-dioxygenase-like lactoylglutathione lyase family enzyme